MEFENIDFQTSGYTLQSFELYEVYAINITYEYDYSTGVFLIQ